MLDVAYGEVGVAGGVAVAVEGDVVDDDVELKV